MEKIQQEEHKKKGAFFLEVGGERLAEMLYFHSNPGEITIYHTEVDPSLAGKGVGYDLVAAGVEFARENGLKIVPTCSYAKKVIDKTPEFQDVLA
ncbi:MAG TPA: GNAT family N-acetyltransferase [Pyrinomonadaceae bacterium]|nr:GNAT family N-acetyltransferase [Pyrinomonadaceae bacterium]